MSGQSRRAVLRLFGVAALAALGSALLFALCYARDNQYTAAGPQASSGVLMLSEEDLREHPLVYLTAGWELYQGKLLTPEDFAAGSILPDAYVLVGRYGGSEGRADSRNSLHGSATYRLSIVLPPQTESYLLEVPEIASAYRLYINGEEMAGTGRPEAGGYRAETGYRKVFVRCAGRMEVIVAAADDGPFDSGMVHPPAFGRVQAVEALLNIRFGLRFAGAALSAGMGLFHLGIWLLLQRHRSGADCLPLLYGALCLSFALCICDPVVKTLTATGRGWHVWKGLAFPAALLLATAVQSRVCGLRGWPAKAMTALGALVCGWAAVRPLMFHGGMNRMMAHSAVLTAYAWMTALFLLIASVVGVCSGSFGSEILLAGAVALGTALVMDRLLPLFEPMRLGRFVELAGGFFVLCAGAVLTVEIAEQFHLRLQLEARMEQVTHMLEAQKAYYPEILRKEEDLRQIRHDFHHHMAVIRELAAAGDSARLLAYAESLGERISPQGSAAYCKHYVIDMLLRIYAGLAAAQQTEFAAEASLPGTLPFADVDLCVVLGNLLENALEASQAVPREHRRIAVGIRCRRNHFGLMVENTFDGVMRKRGSRLLSRKRGGQEGIGLWSVRAVCQSYGGSAEWEIKENNVFRAELLLPMREGGKNHENRDL